MRIYVLVFLVLLYASSEAQNSVVQKKFFKPDSIYNPKRATYVAVGVGAVYITSMAGLYSLWYRDYPSSSFHTFDDSEEWMQMDKIGHIGSAYYLSRWSGGLVSWTGVSNKKSAWIGAGMGFFYQTTIEVFDGFSSQWGFSVSDLAANATGSLLYLTQQLAWNEQKIQFKFSFHKTDYSQYRPNVLGTDITQNIIKDYNGQTYWLSTNIHSWLPSTSRFPKWLNFAVGYGIDGVTGANENPEMVNGVPIPVFERSRQFYFAPDVDLTKIKTRSPFLKTMFEVFGFIKFPAPTLEYNQNGKWSFKPLYF